ncbi:MAG TPA: hypothetical protein VK911_07895 [Vicinamibacterales bacterium]|nr:hypothetical protein [Vicinamibacterales bacterium]
MRFTLRDLVYIGVFGAIWGAVEATLGALLHVLRVPFTGLVLAAAGVTIALIGRLFVPRPGSVAAIGLVTALLKGFSLGGFVFNPMIAIIAESLIVELVVLTLGARRPAFVIAGGLALLWPVVHPLVTQTLLAGRAILAVYLQTLESVMNMLGVGPEALAWALAAYAAVHVAAGMAAGRLAWEAGQAAARRVGRGEGQDG